MLKKIVMCFVSILLSLGCCFIQPLAYENDVDTITHYDFPEVSDDEVRQQVKEIIKEKYNLYSIENIKVYSAEDLINEHKIMPREVTLVGTAYKYSEEIGWAKNQYPNGVSFQYGGYLYWEDDNSNDVSVDFSIGGYGFSVGVSVGSKTDGVTGYASWCPANTRCKLKVFKDLKIQRWYVETQVSGGGIYRDYVNTVVTMSADFTVTM